MSRQKRHLCSYVKSSSLPEPDDASWRLGRHATRRRIFQNHGLHFQLRRVCRPSRTFHYLQPDKRRGAANGETQNTNMSNLPNPHPYPPSFPRQQVSIHRISKPLDTLLPAPAPPVQPSSPCTPSTEESHGSDLLIYLVFHASCCSPPSLRPRNNSPSFG
jgi:hypothetical protein